ncbi:MAG: hypothetical protein F4139_13640 [Gemmatimonadetes bacterium]|nr:hypothetical protein [Gemmatimonadota bacterium]MYH53966.1 hypothetical protein [Gemmatimonadota bacterium]MYK65799.1 hypothetical protein [Gemmatimonadota bacterium]
MMGDRRRRIGRFGIGRLGATVAAVAAFAVSPAIVSVAGSHLDGVGFAIVEAVFGEPVSAQECTDINGNPRMCTATEKFGHCLNAADDNFAQCTDFHPWWREFMCWAALAVDSASCGAGMVGDVLTG